MISATETLHRWEPVHWISTPSRRRPRTRLVGISTYDKSCPRLIRALAMETHDQWTAGPRYLFDRVGMVRTPMPDIETFHEAT